MKASEERKILSVSQLNRRVKQLLETHLPLIWVSGEISNLTRHGSGHWYFSLKDEQAQIRCAMFRNANQRLRWHPKQGDKALLRARVSLYEGRGDYQLIVEHMEPAGSGLLQQQFEATKAKLAAEGLFADERKKALPMFPQNIGIITSATGAAIHDILSVLRRRYPIGQVTLFPVSVQGEEAPQEMLLALEKLKRYGECDVVIIGRGGGSMEDLWAFNHEDLARAIASFPVPIVSAVGHEVDITISDFVADVRAPTPTASAELITPDLNEWLQYLDHQHDQLITISHKILQQQKKTLDFLHKRLRHPKELIVIRQQRLKNLKQQLCQRAKHFPQYQHITLKGLYGRLHQQHPANIIAQKKNTLQHYKKRLIRSSQQVQKNKKEQLQYISALMSSLNPLQVLARGYSITRQKNGDIIKDSTTLHTGDEISTVLSTGKIESVITKIKK